MKQTYLVHFSSYITVISDNVDEGYEAVDEWLESMTGEEALEIIRDSCYETEYAYWINSEDEE